MAILEGRWSMHQDQTYTHTYIYSLQVYKVGVYIYTSICINICEHTGWVTLIQKLLKSIIVANLFIGYV